MINRPNLYILSENRIASDALKKFESECNDLEESYIFDKLTNINNYIYSSISGLPLDRFFISLTSSHSIFYRFKTISSPYEIKWELFLDEDGDEDFYCALHIYNNSVKEKSIHGTIDVIYDVIINTLFSQSYSFANEEIAQIPQYA